MATIAANDVFEDAYELERDLALLENLRWARKEFMDRLCASSESRDDDVLMTLRSEAAYQLAEFLYLLRAQQIESVEQIKLLAELHNEYIVGLTKDAAKVARMGLGSDRLLDAIFTADTLPKLLSQWGEAPGTFDQSNLARFLAALMSTETCRKLLVCCDKAGFLLRKRSAYGSILVKSAGTLERLFAEVLRDLRRQTERARNEKRNEQ